METVLQFDTIDYYYMSGEQKISILEQASYDFTDHKLYTIVGPSGSGKTTSLFLAGALEKPRSGRVLYKGKDLSEIGLNNYRNQKIGIVFQSYNLLTYFTPLKNVLAAMDITKNNIPNKKQRAEELLSRMGLTKNQINRKTTKLSGGEQQRVAIARALATDAEIILADEPTGNLDIDTAKEIIGLFQELAHEYKKCVIAVTHSEEFANAADEVVCLKDHKFAKRKINSI
ncbi:MAG: ABC transporter ATP-binding protein [bacterium]|nr:ABC transporter ATP-binding protein [bacterium]